MRWLRLVVLVALVGGLYLFQRTVLRPEPARLEAFAENALLELFGPDVRHGRVVAQPLDGVRIEALSVHGPEGGPPGLFADAVEIRHDPLALTAGVLRLRSVTLERPVLTMRETAGGEIELGFPFHPPRPRGGRAAPLPAIDVRDGVVRLEAHATSTKFRGGTVLTLSGLALRAAPGAGGEVDVEGSFLPEGVGLASEETVAFRGYAHPERGVVDLLVVWERLLLTPQLRGLLSDELLAGVDARHVADGPHRLEVRLVRDPDVEAGRLRALPRFEGTLRVDIAALPGAETIDARTREQINELFGRMDLSVEVSGSRVDVRRLSTSLAGAQVRAQGRIEDGGEVVDLDLRIEDLRLDDPALLGALGPLGDEIKEEFAVAGRADVLVTLRKARGGAFTYEAVVDLVDATIVYTGKPMPGRTTPAGNPMRDGFPWAARHCFGRVTVRPGEVRFSPIEGRHGPARVRIRGAGETTRHGTPTGYVRWGDGDTEVALTVEATDIPVDDELAEAVEGSSFAGFLDRFRPEGVVNRLVVDVRKRPHLDRAAFVELEVGLSRQRFVYAPFPLPLSDVDAKVVLSRPVGPDGTLGKRFDAEATGRAAGAPVTVRAALDEVARRGRVVVEATGIPLRGPLEAAVRTSEPGRGALGETWDYLRPSGTADVVADLPASDDPGPPRWSLTLHDGAVRLGGDDPDTGIDLHALEGQIRVEGDRTEVVRVEGRVGHAPLTLVGTLDAGPRGRWDLRIAARGIGLTRGLLAAIERASPCDPIFPPGIRVLPKGQLDLDLRLRREPTGPDCVLTAAVAVRNATLEARVGDLPFSVTGGFSVDGDDVHMEDLRLEGPSLSLRIPAGRYGPAGIEGRLHARLSELVVTPELLGLLPESIRPAFADATRHRLLVAPDLSVDVDASGALTVRGALGLTARAGAPVGGAPRGLVRFDPLHVSAADAAARRTLRGRLLLEGLELDVGTRIEEVWGALDVERLLLAGEPTSAAGALRLSRARVAGLSLEDVAVPLALDGGVLTAAPITATFYGGRLSGRLALHTRAPVAFEGALAVDDLSLEALVAELAPGLEVRGTTTVRLAFESATGAFADLVGSGAVTVRDGDLGELPPIASVPALLSSLVPGARKPRFTRADADVVLDGERVVARRLVLAGPLFSMEGHGVYDTAGTIDVTLAPQFLKHLLLPGALQLPGVRDLLGLLREDPLYVVRIAGPVGTAKPVLAPLPFLSRPRAAPEVAPPPMRSVSTRRIPRWFR